MLQESYLGQNRLEFNFWQFWGHFTHIRAKIGAYVTKTAAESAILKLQESYLGQNRLELSF